MRFIALLLCLALTATLAAIPAAADKGRGSDDGDRREWADEDRSHDRARRATERGEILPLTVIYERALARLPGRVLEAELERKHGLWVYELKILDADGRLYEVHLDAGTGAVLKQEEDD
ncbi:MAG: PepSY domain-containing protein [Bdellovibrio bacteriovorus]